MASRIPANPSKPKMVVPGTAYAARTLKLLLVAELRPGLLAMSVWPAPPKVVERPLKLATLTVILAVVVPTSAAPKVPVPGVMPSVTGAEEVVTVLPMAS